MAHTVSLLPPFMQSWWPLKAYTVESPTVGDVTVPALKRKRAYTIGAFSDQVSSAILYISTLRMGVLSLVSATSFSPPMTRKRPSCNQAGAALGVAE